MRVALVYDRINKWGGAERVLLTLHELFPEAPLYTIVYDKQKAAWADVFDIKTSFLQHVPFAKGNHEYFGWITPLAAESMIFDEFDVVISVSSADVKAVITKPHTLHINYCLTPTRYLWSHYDEYFKNPLLKFFAYPLTSHLKRWDRVVAHRPDHMIAISTQIQKRIHRFYSKKADLIYPPLSSSFERLSGDKTGQANSTERYFLVVSRLVSYKRVDLAIDACQRLGMRLVVVGKGRQENNLKERAKDANVLFLSEVSDEELRILYKNAEALIVPQEEDFGLVMVEAHYYGTPVIAYNKGGAMDIVQPGKTGELFDDQTPASICNVLTDFDRSQYAKQNFDKSVSRFTSTQFKKAFMSYVNAAYNKHLANYKRK